MLPVRDDNHVAEAVELLISRFRNLPVISGLVKALTLRLQEIEGDLWTLINGVQLSNHPMAGGTWSVLDQIGAIVGAPRLGRTDAQYVPFLRLTIRANRSHGLAEDVIQIAQIALGKNPYYQEYAIAASVVEALGITSEGLHELIPILTRARAAATYGQIVYSIGSAGNEVSLTSIYGGFTPTDGGLGSVYAPLVGGVLTATVSLG